MINLKNAMMTLSLIGSIATPLVFSRAQGSAGPIIGLHLECSAGETECQEHQDGYEKILIHQKPDVILSPETVLDFYYTPGEMGRDVAGVRLSASEGEKLKVLTTANRQKRLAIVVAGKVMSSPVIQSAISDRMQISFGANSPDEAFKDVPWAIEMAKKAKSSEETKNLVKIISYLLIALALIGGSVYVAFFRGRKQSEVK